MKDEHKLYIQLLGKKNTAKIPSQGVRYFLIFVTVYYLYAMGEGLGVGL